MALSQQAMEKIRIEDIPTTIVTLKACKQQLFARRDESILPPTMSLSEINSLNRKINDEIATLNQQIEGLQNRLLEYDQKAAQALQFSLNPDLLEKKVLTQPKLTPQRAALLDRIKPQAFSKIIARGIQELDNQQKHLVQVGVSILSDSKLTEQKKEKQFMEIRQQVIELDRGKLLLSEYGRLPFFAAKSILKSYFLQEAGATAHQQTTTPVTEPFPHSTGKTLHKPSP